MSNAVRIAGQGSTLSSITVADNSRQNAAFSIVLFDAKPTTATITDHVAFSFGATDIAKAAALFPITSQEYVNIDSGSSIATVPGINVYIKNNENTLFLYAALVVAAGGPHYTSVSSLQFIFAFSQD